MRVSITEIANLTGLDRKRIALAVADLEHEDGKQGAKLFESKEAIPMLYVGGVFDDKKERARLTHHQANLAELDELSKRRDLVQFSDVVLDVSESLANMRAKLLTIPTKVSAVVVGMDDLYEIQSVLESAVYEALTELHNQYCGDESSGGSAKAPAKAQG